MARFKARAKINLSLHITHRREDGYHALCSLVAFSEFGDDLRVFDAKPPQIRVSGEFAKSVNPLENSLTRALRWFEDETGIKVKKSVDLAKHIPVEAGLGGGTADAAAMIHALCELYDARAPKASALSALGADVPVSFYGQTAVMEGIGEVIAPAKLDQDFGVVLVNPRVSISTVKMFSVLSQFDKAFEKKDIYTLDHIRDMTNSFQLSAIALVPEIGEIISALDAEGAWLSRMTGSGASVFGLCAPHEADALAANIQRKFPNFWVMPSQIRRSTT